MGPNRGGGQAARQAGKGGWVVDVQRNCKPGRKGDPRGVVTRGRMSVLRGDPVL